MYVVSRFQFAGRTKKIWLFGIYRATILQNAIKTKIKKIVSIDSINHWQNDSLYVYADDIDAFFKEYAQLFNSGTYSNLETGVVDLFGINYYATSAIDSLIAKICECRPIDYESLINWLSEGKAYNGFYILGI